MLTLATLASCSSGTEDTPTRLLNGSPPRDLLVELDGVDAPVLTAVRVDDVGRVGRGSAAGSCLSEFDTIRAGGPVVTRVGVVTESVTFGTSSDHAVAGCNNSRGAQEANRRWCGSAYGQLYDGRLRDPRLDVLCGTIEAPVGFVWVTPSQETRYVSVEQPGYVEVYEVAGDLPVRVATVDGVVYEQFAASFDVLEHDAEGQLIRKYTLEAAVAG